jgi:ribose 5-phosphate isomerase A
LNLIKGLGGALLREKIVASASKKLVIIVHHAKVASRLALDQPLPIEIVPFGWESTAQHLTGLGAKPTLRRTAKGEVFLTDGGHYIVDCTFAPGVSPAWLARRLDHVVGLVEHGLFIGMASEVHVAGTDGIEVLK